MNGEKTSPVHWRYEVDDTGICRLTFDREGASTNVLTRDVLLELGELVEYFSGQDYRALIIRSAKKNGFIAGADINEFTTLGTREEALELIHRGQDIFTELEHLPYPTVCLIHGFCLGGGLELALACTYRIAADSPTTKIGLPEVKLGIHPGFGGTVRLSRLLGGPAALPLILSGRFLSARKAAKLGVVTHAVPERLLESSALKLIKSPPKKSFALITKLAAGAPVRSLTVALARRKLEAKVRREQYPAPYAVLDLWEKHGGSKGMMREEANSIAELIRGETAQNLIRVFFLQERLKSLPAEKGFKPRHVHVVGAGVMGTDIAAWCAFKGFRVSVQDNSHDILARSVRRAAELFRRKLKAPHLVRAAMDRYMPDIEGNMAHKADMVIEAIFENVDAKKNLFHSLEPKLKPGSVLATNTSSIPLETLAEDLEHPERLVGLHFFNPVAKMMLVEVVRTPHTDETVVNRAIQFTKGIGKLPLPVKSSPGFLVNRILMPYLHEAAVMESEGIPPQLIDQAAEKFGMPVGPIELIDLVGLDVCYSVGEFMTDDPVLKMPGRLKELIDQGRLGKKSGAGYYDYDKNKVVKPTTDKGDPPADLADRLVLRLVNESVACLREEVVADGDLLDAGMIFGTGFAPFRGGVIHYTKGQQVDTMHDRIRELHKHYGERFKPDPGWEVLRTTLFRHSL